AGVGPPVFMPVAGIRDVGIGKSEVALGFWIVSRFVREIDLLAMLLLHFLVYMRHVNGLLFVGRGRGKKHEQVVALSRRSLRGSLGRKVDKVDVVDDDIRIVLLSPLFAESPVEPGVVRRNEVAPLKNFQRLLLSRRAFWEQKKRAGTIPAARGLLPGKFRKFRRESPSRFFPSLF